MSSHQKRPHESSQEVGKWDSLRIRVPKKNNQWFLEQGRGKGQNWVRGLGPTYKMLSASWGFELYLGPSPPSFFCTATFADGRDLDTKTRAREWRERENYRRGARAHKGDVLEQEGESLGSSSVNRQTSPFQQGGCGDEKDRECGKLGSRHVWLNRPMKRYHLKALLLGKLLASCCPLHHV